VHLIALRNGGAVRREVRTPYEDSHWRLMGGWFPDSGMRSVVVGILSTARKVICIPYDTL